MGKNDGGPAFPICVSSADGMQNVNAGMSLRDWFAGKFVALEAARYDSRVVTQYELVALFGERIGLEREEIIAALCYRNADAMLAAREEPGNG